MLKVVNSGQEVNFPRKKTTNLNYSNQEKKKVEKHTDTIKTQTKKAIDVSPKPNLNTIKPIVSNKKDDDEWASF